MSCNTEGLIKFFLFRLRQRKYLTVVLSLHHSASWFTSVSIHIAKIDVNRIPYGNFYHARQELKKVALKAQIAVFTLEKDYPSKTYV